MVDRAAVDATPAACCVAASAELAAARVLARSYATYHPGRSLTVLLADDRAGRIGDGEPFSLYPLDDLPIDPADLHEIAVSSSPEDLCAVLQPLLVAALLERTGAAVVALAPETKLFGSLDGFAALSGEHPVVLVPRADAPLGPGEPPEVEALALGAFDLGLVAVSPEARAFVAWWAERVERRPSLDRAGIRASLARFVDLAPAYFDVAVCKDPGQGLSVWNAERRPLVATADGYEAAGSPLTSVRFPGFDPRRPYLLSTEAAQAPRARVAASPALVELCRTYASELLEAGYEETSTTAYGWSTLADGTTVTAEVRQAVAEYRLARADGCLVERPPDPYRFDSVDAFYRWLASPEPLNDAAPSVARLFYPIWRQRPDLRLAFPDLALADAARFRAWAGVHGLAEYPVPPPVAEAAFANSCWPEPAQLHLATPGGLRAGVLLAGYVDADLGVGEAARRAVAALEQSGVEVGVVPFGLTKSRRREQPTPVGPLDLDTNLVWVNADQLGYFVRLVGPRFFEGRYTVGAWAWETENPPAAMGEMAAFVDEIWVPSEFTRRAVSSVTDTPVHVFGHPVSPPRSAPALEVPGIEVPGIEVPGIEVPGIEVGGRFVFLFMFDFLSTVSRKNPTGLIEAFRRAFRPDEGPLLVLKSINGEKVPVELDRVRIAIGDRLDVVLVDEYRSDAECAAMLARADCYASLHRAEGFGLTLADAMALGKPVVATGYSGNLDFMDDETAFLVPASTVRVGPGAPPYGEDELWGDPDLDAAAEVLRRVYEQPAEARRVAERGRAAVLSHHGPERAARFLETRLAEIAAWRRAGGESGVAAAVARALSDAHWDGSMRLVPAGSEGA